MTAIEPMPTPTDALRRRRFLDGLAPDRPTTEWARHWLRVLLLQDGSATLLCEIVAGGPIRLDVTHQVITRDVPDEVRELLPGDTFIERQVCLSFDAEVMMDNLTYVACDRVDPTLRQYLLDGTAPIGHLFDRRWTRKQTVAPIDAVVTRLWDRSGLPDPAAVRAYLLQMPESTCMLITETFRAGMRWRLPVDPSPA
ncbi:MAG: chorismate pyruvate-lyase family protein [Burkholderiaceae bacterium]